jgi:hypothetical protein
MKLVETDIPHGDEEVAEVPRPPRPEHRRVYVSLLVTMTVLVATVVAVYVAFPKRDNALLTSAVHAHRSGGPFQLERPTPDQLKAWTVGVVGGDAPWPEPAEAAEVVGTWQIVVLRRPAALVRYQVGDVPVTVLATRTRDVPPRRYRREDNGQLARSWRTGPWTLIAVGPAESADDWTQALGVP